VVRMTPAQQGFESGDPVRFERDDRLVLKEEFFSFERPSEICLREQAKCQELSSPRPRAARLNCSRGLVRKVLPHLG